MIIYINYIYIYVYVYWKYTLNIMEDIMCLELHFVYRRDIQGYTVN